MSRLISESSKQIDRRNTMKRHSMTRVIVFALVFSLVQMPILGTLTSSPASAQTVQNSTYTYQYDDNGNVTQVTDPLGRATNLAYDVLGRPIKQTLPSPHVNAARPVVQHAYDGQDRVSTVTDPRMLVTTYSADGLGNQGVLDSPDTGTTLFTYDLAGNLKTSTDARGKVSTYSYDAINRVTRIDYASGPSTVFEYDGGAAGVPYAMGKLTGMIDESGSTTYAYDAFGRMTTKTQTVALGNTARAFTVGYAYGATGTGTGKIASVTYPSGNRVNYFYDSAGQLNRLTLDPAEAGNGGVRAGASIDLLTGIFYTPFGGVQSWYWGNSTDAAVNGYARTFDLDGRITSYTLGNVQTNGVLRHVNYDAAGRILGYTHEGASAAPAPVALDQTFAYDDLDRLTGNQSVTTSLGFAYDANGNRTQATIGGNTYANVIDMNSNRLLSAAGPAPVRTNIHDSAGNVTSDGTVAYFYSDRGRLAQVDKLGMSTSYLYNGIGQRVYKHGPVVQSGTNYFVYDEQGHVLGEYGSGGAALQETVYLGNTPVVVLADGIFYVSTDHLDTPRLITRNSDNAIVWRWDVADPFGVQTPLENPSGLGKFTYNLRFPGQLFDSETNNHYNYHRDYDPQTGRYIQSDPIGLEGGMNTYGYVGGNPVSQIDPLGLACTTANGITTCNYPGGPSFKIPAGPGSPQQISGWNPLYHMYDVIQPLGQADLQCVLDKIRNNPTPGDPSPATLGGTANNAVVGGQPNWVTSYTTTDLTTGGPLVVNVTGPKSAFGPGYVARGVIDGTMHTWGEGTHPIQSMFVPSMVRTVANELVWGKQMKKFVDECTCKK